MIHDLVSCSGWSVRTSKLQSCTPSVTLVLTNKSTRPRAPRVFIGAVANIRRHAWGRKNSQDAFPSNRITTSRLTTQPNGPQSVARATDGRGFVAMRFAYRISNCSMWNRYAGPRSRIFHGGEGWDCPLLFSGLKVAHALSLASGS